MSVAHSDRAHARMSPSSAPRWRKCPASYLEGAKFPDPPSSKAAIEGTKRHEWADHALSNGEADVLEYIGTAHPKNPDNVLTAEMAADVGVCLDYVYALLSPEDELNVEQRLDLKRYFGNDDGDGTADCSIFKVAQGHLHVIDFKFGRLEVSPDSMQLVQYGLGAMARFHNRKITKVTLHIVQPASRPAGKSLDLLSADMWDAGEDLKEDVAKARKPGAAFVPGEHCRFCKVAANGACEALRRKAEADAKSGFEAIEDVANFDAARLGEMLDGLKAIEVYVKTVKEAADAHARAGRMPRGYKWVATPGRRVWNMEPSSGGYDAENVLAYEVRKALALDYGPLEMFERTLISPPAVEKIVGKVHMPKLQAFIKSTAGGFSLVPETDKRKAVEYTKSTDGFEALTE